MRTTPRAIAFVSTLAMAALVGLSLLGPSLLGPSAASAQSYPGELSPPNPDDPFSLDSPIGRSRVFEVEVRNSATGAEVRVWGPSGSAGVRRTTATAIADALGLKNPEDISVMLEEDNPFADESWSDDRSPDSEFNESADIYFQSDVNFGTVKGDERKVVIETPRLSRLARLDRFERVSLRYCPMIAGANFDQSSTKPTVDDEKCANWAFVADRTMTGTDKEVMVAVEKGERSALSKLTLLMSLVGLGIFLCGALLLWVLRRFGVLRTINGWAITWILLLASLGGILWIVSVAIIGGTGAGHRAAVLCDEPLAALLAACALPPLFLVLGIFGLCLLLAFGKPPVPKVATVPGMSPGEQVAQERPTTQTPTQPQAPSTPSAQAPADTTQADTRSADTKTNAMPSWLEGEQSKPAAPSETAEPARRADTQQTPAADPDPQSGRSTTDGGEATDKRDDGGSWSAPT